ncbi:MAG: histidinol-phosphate aminotransferase family protein [Bacteroidetes bacterium]|nr:histidinol-phosphate aminotransferase family protein [Bacteroidota bacterium]
MSTSQSRRQWLKSSLLFSAGAAAFPASAWAADSPEFSYPEAPEVWMPEREAAAVTIRLNANENPYGPSDKARLAIVDALKLGNRYPWLHTPELVSMIAKKEGLKEENILLGAGSSELLAKAGFAFGMAAGAQVISANPTFMSLMRYAQVAGAKWVPVELTAKYAHDFDAMEAAMKGENNLMYICNPNNPTGTLTPANDIEAFCKRVSKHAPIFCDEAYNEFLDEPKKHSMVHLINEGYPVMVAKTFSKIHGMAGLRIGYLMGRKEEIEKVAAFDGRGMTLAATSVKAAIASYQDEEFVKECLAKNAAVRKHVCQGLENMGIEYIPSYTNFMMFKIPMSTQAFIGEMQSHGVGIRGWEMKGGPWCRVSMGTMDEMDGFLAALKKVV